MSDQNSDDTLPTAPSDHTALPPPQAAVTEPAEQQAAYRVLARKYRPADFHTLIGQDALVRTLSNAIRTGRLAQAYVLTGVRGVGKTTTARIIARCLNCIGPDGNGGPTVEPCGVCDNCRAIAEDRHVDVFEMDAASRTGVGDIRELIESVRYRPTSARYKIYIIDEVHMLSTGAFNALLKTLEEPPEHVKFIFATTEIRKVPVTVLSRCQRFDLRRVTVETLAAHFTRISQAEGANVQDGAIRLLARAADGSVRDGLSLLDQAIAQAGAGQGGEGEVNEDQVRTMLGLADRGLVFDLFDAIMKGDIATALGLLGDQYAAGADPVVVLNDMLELTHWLTRLKITPDSADDPLAAEAERVRGREMASALSVAILTRTWQMLLKGVSEARGASAPLQAVEMVLIRLAYAAQLPTPGEALQKAKDGALPQASAPVGVPSGSGPLGSSAGSAAGSAAGSSSGVSSGPQHSVSQPPGPSGQAMMRVGNGAPTPTPPPTPAPNLPPEPQVAQEPAPWDPLPDQASRQAPHQVQARSNVVAYPGPRGGQQSPAPAQEPLPSAQPASWDQPSQDGQASYGQGAPGGGYGGGRNALPVPETFLDMVSLFLKKRELLLHTHLERSVHLVRYDPKAPRLEFRPTEQAPSDLAANLSKSLGGWTGRRWAVIQSKEQGDPTLLEQTLTGAKANPLVQAVLAAFPESYIGVVRDLEDVDTGPLPDAAPMEMDGGDGDMDGYGAYDPSIDFDFDSFEP